MTRKKFGGLVTATLITLMGTSGATAATLDFGSLGLGNLGTTTASLPEATITSLGGNLFVGAAGVSDEICALNTLSFSCEADIRFDFTSPVGSLSLETFGFNVGDSGVAIVYDASLTILASIAFASDTTIDFGSISGISRLFIDDSSTGAGFGYGNFSFTVPEPATLLLLGAGLLGIGAGRRRLLKTS